jgi:hypothetical protein
MHVSKIKILEIGMMARRIMLIMRMINCVSSYICSLLRSFLHTGTREAVVSTPSTYKEHLQSFECEGARDPLEMSLKVTAISQPDGQRTS